MIPHPLSPPLRPPERVSRADHGPPSNGCPGPNDPRPNEASRLIDWTALVGVALTDMTLPVSQTLGPF